MVEKGSGSSGSGSSAEDAERNLERERTKNALYSSVDSSEAVNTVGFDDFGETSAGEEGNCIRVDDNHDEEASGASSYDDDVEEDSEEEVEDWFAETETYRDLYRQFEEDTDAALEKELDEQMEAMWDEYSGDVHAQIQNELDQALQQQMDAQFNETYNHNRVELDLQLEDNWDELESSSTRQPTRRFPVEHHSSVESINALIQQVVEKHRVHLEF